MPDAREIHRILERGMDHYSIYEQDCWGTIHWRVQRNNGDRLVFGTCHQADFPNRAQAVETVRSHCHRTRRGYRIDVYRKPATPGSPGVLAETITSEGSEA